VIIEIQTELIEIMRLIRKYKRSSHLLKHPFLACLLKKLDQIFEAKFIFVRRNITEIEFGRIRRIGVRPLCRWREEGYSHMEKFLHSKQKEFILLGINTSKQTIKEVKLLARFCNLKHDKNR